MSNILKKLVQNGTEYSLPTEIYIIPESVITKATTKTYGVEPYNENYYYTDFTISADAGVKWEEGKLYLINWDSMTVSSSYRNARFRIGTGAYIPLMTSGGAILSGYTYCKKSYTRPYYYSTKYQSGGALHLLEDDNTTYSSMSVAEGQTGTATTARSLTATNLKGIINYHAPEDMIVTQTDYDNLPSDKNSDNRTYFICELDTPVASSNEYTLGEYTSSEMQEWLNDYAPDMEELVTLLGSTLVNKINSELHQINGSYNLDTVEPTDPIGTITGAGGLVLSPTSSPAITDGVGVNDNYILCLPIDANGDIIVDNISYIYDNPNNDDYISLQKYSEWSGLGAVAVDVLGLSIL